MGLVADLGYSRTAPNAVQRGFQLFAGSRFGAWLFSKILKPMDVVIDKVTHGRFTGPEILAGLPVIWLTTTGRKSGAPRTNPLVGVPLGQDILVVGSNFGQKKPPAWAFNLDANPSATVRMKGSTVDVTARRATEEEAEQAWTLGAGVYSGFPKYRDRLVSREVKIFVLSAVDR